MSRIEYYQRDCSRSVGVGWARTPARTLCFDARRSSQTSRSGSRTHALRPRRSRRTSSKHDLTKLALLRETHFSTSQITLLTGKLLGLLVSGPESAIAHDALLAHAWVAPPRVSIDPVRVEASKVVVSSRSERVARRVRPELEVPGG